MLDELVKCHNVEMLDKLVKCHEEAGRLHRKMQDMCPSVLLQQDWIQFHMSENAFKALAESVNVPIEISGVEPGDDRYILQFTYKGVVFCAVVSREI